MLRRWRLGSGLLIAALTASLIGPVGPAWAAPGEPRAPDAAAAATRAKPRNLTLLTGDRLTVTGDGKVAVQRGKGRQGIAFLTRRVGGHLHVVPSDALPLLRAGRLDSRLFDVTALLEFGYDDRRADLPLIVTAGSPARASTRATVAAEGGRVVRDLPAVGGLAVRADKHQVGELWQTLTGGASNARTLRAGLSTVWLDGLRKPSLNESVPQIGAPAAWRAGFDGAGVKVAVLDTGIDRSHPDLADRIVAGQNFTEGTEDDADRVGHGTHVASTIAGSGAASNGTYKGVAPGARLLDGKVCVEFGCAESWILAGMQWAAEQGAAVVNMSLGGLDTPEVDPVEQAVQNLTEQYDTLFVVAAGNAGADASVGSPASADAALAVGAVTKQDELADFSSRGPRAGDSALKPDITAPGVDIVAANSKDGSFGEPGQPYATASGTSMATPHVAGAAAILAQQHSDYSPAQLKATLMGAAKPNPQVGAYAQGAGRVDVARAITQSVTTSPPSISFGRQLWPHGDDPPMTRTVTYRNAGGGAVTLDLALRTLGPDGEVAPAGAFSVSASTVTVPARGQASVTVTADTRVPGPDGYYTGRLDATAGGVAVTTPFAVDREVESYDLKLRYLGRDGQLTGQFFGALLRLDGLAFHDVFDPDGELTVRLPKGRYALVNMVFGGDEASPEASLLAQPQLDLTRDQAVTVDARLAKPVSVTVPRADATAVLAEVSAEIITPEFIAGFSLLGDGFAGMFSGQLGPDRTVDGFIGKVGGTFAKVRADGSADNSPFIYHLAWFSEGRLFTGFQRTLKPGQLATVRAGYARQAQGASGWKAVFPVLPGKVAGGWAILLPFRLPFTRTEYYNTDGGAQWQSIFEEWLPIAGEPFPETVAQAEARPTAYRAGRPYTEQWNHAVFGPALPESGWPDLWVSRVGDTLVVLPPLHGDGAGRAGFSTFESGYAKVYRNGKKIAESALPGGFFDVPAGAAKYRVAVGATRVTPHVLSTRVDVTWTFRSAHVSDDAPQRLPLSVVRFTPRLDAYNAARAGRHLAIPAVVQPQPGSAARACESLSVQVSFDDGRTWTAVRVVGHKGKRLALVKHPDRAGFVSLRAKATDTAGNTVEQTVIRAYRLK
ncbi:MAG TPA: S8 family serine peptidase [Micromonosporaceae bacterium]|nr:S8 family serine peptidase [Micromonosporaceae bacterium]